VSNILSYIQVIEEAYRQVSLCGDPDDHKALYWAIQEALLACEDLEWAYHLTRKWAQAAKETSDEGSRATYRKCIMELLSVVRARYHNETGKDDEHETIL